ncbi:MAG TPA: DEAD/DEAH box helicase [Prolixibacteraceae bacterium]|nr:DEAD/DEAH box helicase [Prolixibacteraceae bacterium]
MAQEFIIALTEHRALGNILVPILIEEERSYYTVKKVVKLRDFKSGEVELNESELELLKLIESFSDEILVKKFSKKINNHVFFQDLDKDLFLNHISPYIDKYIYKCVLLLMKCNTRLFFKQAKYSHLYSEDEIQLNKTFSEPVFHFNRDENGTQYHLEINHEGQTIDLLHKTIKMVCTLPCCFVYLNQLFVFKELSGKKLAPFLTKENISILRQSEDKYYQTFVLNSIKEAKVIATGFDIIESRPPRKTILSLEQNLAQKPVLIVKFKYENNLYLADSVSNVFVSFEKTQDNYSFKKFVRDHSWEEEQLAFLKELGLKYTEGYWNTDADTKKPETENYYRPVQWITKNREELENLGYQIQQNKLNTKYFTGSQTLDIQVKSDEDWFDIHAMVKFGDYQIPFIKLRKNILSDIREFELPSGEIAILPLEWFSSYRDIFPFAKLEGNIMKLKKHHFQLLHEKLEGLDRNYFDKLDHINPESNQQVELPAGLNAQLRNYQEEGFSWMHHLYENQLGGCLADDMGLGKTIQTLTLLLKLKKENSTFFIPVFDDDKQLPLPLPPAPETPSEIQPASLIVMPTSLVHNWANEIQKFSPSLKVYKHIGSTRSRATEMASAIRYYDVILTTYGTLRNDYEMLRKFDFFYLILDESQNIKNSSSKTYKSIIEIRSKHKLVITGTPIENSLSDLWSQLNFLNKGLLGSLPYFKREFITPIEKKNDQEQQMKLQKLIRPFVLRRKKEEVAKDLPPLTEQIRVCEMTEEQREIYETEKSAIRNTILKNIETNGMKNSALVVLQGLTKLRQLANHPSLVTKEHETESGKFNEIYRCLKNLVAEKHKVLIFSSFVKHLDLLQAKIESKKWKYSVLTGKTTNRQEVIQQFQEDPDNHIFLISLKAGGVGLNLTSADYVFIIDPWWNPAAENQAINRAHRIGQDKKVFVYRFITEDSIEEKIQVLKSKKSALAEKFISSNNPINVISQEEIMSLFS